MVSRGGRSKGCENCRRRKVKCDETRPVCMRCKKRGVICEGPKDVTWVNQNERFNTQNQSFNTQQPNSTLVKTARPKELSLAAFEQDMCLAYTRKILLRGGPVELACNMIDFHENAPALARNPGLNLLRQAMLSLATTFFGKQHHQERMVRSGYSQYGQVLRQLNTTLSKPELQATNETILTALTCMLLEVFLPTGPTNFLKHQRGMEALMELRGPPTEAEGDTATIFRGLRILSIIGALAEGRPSIYARAEWKRAPIAATNMMGMLQHRIFTVLADCTQLVRDRDALMASYADIDLCKSILVRADSALDDLNAIYPIWESFNNARLRKIEQLSEKAKEFGIADQLSATVIMLYHAAQICILKIKESLIPSPEISVLRDRAAREIARCLELKEYERHRSGVESNTIGFVATKVAWQALGDFSSPQAQKLARLVRTAVDGVYESPMQPQFKDMVTADFVSPNTLLDQYIDRVTSAGYLLSPHKLVVKN